jgi:hypothetical protein
MVVTCAVLMGSAVPTDTMPPNTILLSQMMRELSARPGFTEAFLQEIQSGRKRSGPALLTPDLIDHLRELVVGKDWAGLDRFPGWTMAEIVPAVDAVGHIANDEDKLDSPDMWKFIDLGPYAPDRSDSIDLRQASTLPGFTTDGIVTSLGEGIQRGDGPNAFAANHSESQRLADALNRLSINGVEGVPQAVAVWNDVLTASTPQDLIAAIRGTGNDITVTDSRYFANFGHLHDDGQDVMSPFFINTQIVVPGTNRPLLVPAAHAEYEWHIRGPRYEADIAFYFGIDGKAEFRVMDTLDQAWVMKRNAHEYRQSDTNEITRLSGAVIRTYMRLHRAHPEMPFGGYFAFGVCQDVVAAIELKMNGTATLFPNTADERFFTNPKDDEVNALVRRLPKDRNGKPPEVERIFGSLPVGSSEAELATVSIPGLGDDLVAVHQAWTAGKLKRTLSARVRRIRIAAAVLAGVLLLIILWRRSGTHTK